MRGTFNVGTMSIQRCATKERKIKSSESTPVFMRYRKSSADACANSSLGGLAAAFPMLLVSQVPLAKLQARREKEHKMASLPTRFWGTYSNSAMMVHLRLSASGNTRERGP